VFFVLYELSRHLINLGEYSNRVFPINLLFQILFLTCRLPVTEDEICFIYVRISPLKTSILHFFIFFELGNIAPCLPKAMTIQIRTQNPTAVHVGLHIA